MFKFFWILMLLNILSVTAFKTTTCEHDQVTSALATYSQCTVNAIKPTMQSLAMKAGDTVEESSIDQTCALLKKEGPIMKCANDTLGKCFESQDLSFNLKLGGQHSSLLSMQCYSDDTQMVVENDIFFSWLELDGFSADKDETICTIDAVDNTNIAFQKCISNQDEDLIKDTKDVKKAKEITTNSIMKCFDETENPCFSDREMTFLRKEFQTSIEDTMAVIFGMGDLNMMDEEEEIDPEPEIKNSEPEPEPEIKNAEPEPEIKNAENHAPLLTAKLSLYVVTVCMFLRF